MQQSTSTEHGGEPNLVDSTGLCLLSLDGGGVRGLSTLYILKRIMDRLNNERKTTANLPPVKPCEVFDLIGGTSTGGLIAIMLGRLEMDVDECITAYSDLAEAVFTLKKSRMPSSFMGKVQAQFDSAKLEKAIRETVTKCDIPETALLNDGILRGCRTFVCSIDQNTKSIVRLRSYTLPDEANIPATICQAALATTAATTFFEPVRIGNRTFADGGLGANNPVYEAEGEAANIWCSESADLKPLVKCFISIGTGNPGIKAFEEGFFKFLGKTIVQIATETEETEKKFIANWRKHFDENRYFRFNVDQGLQAIGLDEYKKQGAIEAATERYLINQAQKNRVRDCVQNLRLKQNKTETSFAVLLDELTVRTSQRQPTNAAAWIVPFERNPSFTGRETQLAKIQEKLFVKGQTTKCAIWGLGGVGKTQILLELLYRVREKNTDCIVIWIPATNKESLHQAFLDAAQQLRIPGSEDDKSDAKRLVQKHLSQESAGQWLLVFDNADDFDIWFKPPEGEEEANCLINYLPRSKQGNIIFTTRDRKMAVKLSQHDVIEVPQMEEYSAQQLLQKRLVNQTLIESVDDTKALLRQLVYLPLAIVQAASFINENGIALVDYLLLLDDQEEELIELLSKEFEDDGRYRNVKNPVATTWLISFEQIRRRDPLAADYLSFMACIDAKEIPQSLLPPGPSRTRELEAIGTLDAYSFINKRPVGLALDLHRLVHLSTRNWLKLKKEWDNRVNIALHQVRDMFPWPKHENRALWMSYQVHAQCVLTLTKDREKECEWYSLAARIGECCRVTGKYQESENWNRQTLKLKEEVLGETHPDTLATMSNLAIVLERQGNYAEAETMNRQTLKLTEELLGKTHPDTLITMSNLATVLERQGNYAEAETINRQALKLKKEVLGEIHPDTLITMSNLAIVLQRQGNYAEAEIINRQALKLKEEVLGETHPDTLMAMGNLAAVLERQGNYAEAETINRQTLKLIEEVLGETHPDTLISVYYLAFILQNQKEYKEASILYKRACNGFELILGSEHPTTKACVNHYSAMLNSPRAGTTVNIENFKVI